MDKTSNPMKNIPLTPDPRQPRGKPKKYSRVLAPPFMQTKSQTIAHEITENAHAKAK